MALSQVAGLRLASQSEVALWQVVPLVAALLLAVPLQVVPLQVVPLLEVPSLAARKSERSGRGLGS